MRSSDVGCLRDLAFYGLTLRVPTELVVRKITEDANVQAGRQVDLS